MGRDVVGSVCSSIYRFTIRIIAVLASTPHTCWCQVLLGQHHSTSFTSIPTSSSHLFFLNSMFSDSPLQTLYSKVVLLVGRVRWHSFLIDAVHVVIVNIIMYMCVTITLWSILGAFSTCDKFDTLYLGVL
ncbi:hypothetical protein E2C01_009587 [Portunus trituberculatus]|uniref:Uncharacterized protein n=1 Tax=Portunus trituberculatus TaxID=210409 RepID=A0A5B7D668_PORTR|nr:hypothetical protein [Portunus trituberculatus]